jgi:magnesium-transporting ATPase (P-type)
MFQLNMNNNRQHQTLALNSLIMNNIFNLANCFNQFGEFNLRSGFRNHPFFLCVLLLSVALQVVLTELNAFGLENLNPSQWFVCFVFALMSALIAPLTGQQRNQRAEQAAPAASQSAGLVSQKGFRATGAGDTLMNDMVAVHKHDHQRPRTSSRGSRPIGSPSKQPQDNYI